MVGTTLVQQFECDFCDVKGVRHDIRLYDQGFMVFPEVPKGWTRFGVHSLNELACPAHTVTFQVEDAACTTSE